VPFFYLIPLGLIALFIYLQIGRMISATCWNYWDRQLKERHKWSLEDWRARPKSGGERFAIFLLYPANSVLSDDNDPPPIAGYLFNKNDHGPSRGAKEERMRAYLLRSSPLWPIRLVWTLLVTVFQVLRACALGLAGAAKYMMLARVERLPALAAERLRNLRRRHPERAAAQPPDENLVALVDEHRTLDERIIPLQARRREIESHPDFEKARALRARR
jgi:hypothetical protein